MIVLIFFAFLAGIVTVLSPCILPVLPIIFASSASTGRRQPYGVMLGFILSFTFFTLFLTFIVKSTGVSADLLRNISVVIILVFGLVLVIPRLRLWFEILASKLSAKVSSGGPVETEEERSTGFWAGFLLGISLGLVWTPCAGPILAFVVSLALTSTVTAHAFFITLAYAFGTSIPMFAIIYGGRKLIEKLPFLTRNLGKIQRIFGVLMILTAFAIYFNYDRQFQTFILEKFPNYGSGLTKIEKLDIVQEELEELREEMGMDEEKAVDGDLAPELVPSGEWFNSEPLTLEELRGNVILIDFWTYSCINCIRTLPYIESWYEKYKDDGLVVIGVHTPEFEFEKDPDNLAEAIEDFELTYPIVQDNDYSTWQAYDNHYWPAKYFIDADGILRDSHFGEGEYDESEMLIQELLAEAGHGVDAVVDNPEYEIYSITPETYLGYWRMERLASDEGILMDEIGPYTAPDEIPNNEFAFSGDWLVGYERSMPVSGSELILNFESMDVFLVMRPENAEAGQVRVYLDGEVVTDYAGEDVVDGVVTIDKDRLYELVKLEEAGRHILKLEFLDDNVEVYAFTFG